MTKEAVIQGDYVDLKFIKGRKVCQVVVELPIEAGPSVVQAFGTPLPHEGVPVAVARLSGPDKSTEPSAEAEPPKEPRRLQDMPRASQAGMLCNDVVFRQFLREEKRAHIPEDVEPDDMQPKEAADRALKTLLGITSKRQLDDEPDKAAKWDHLRSEYLAWKET